MSTAMKVIDWRNQDGDALARSLEDLPEGRYVLVPENEIDEEDLSPEDEEALEEGFDAIDRGEMDDLEDVIAEIDARIAVAESGRER